MGFDAAQWHIVKPIGKDSRISQGQMVVNNGYIRPARGQRLRRFPVMNPTTPYNRMVENRFGKCIRGDSLGKSACSIRFCLSEEPMDGTVGRQQISGLPYLR